MSITIKIAPLSINKAYRGRRFKTPEYTKWSENVKMMLPKKYKMPDAPYEMELTFGFSNKASDVDNGPEHEDSEQERPEGCLILVLNGVEPITIEER